MDLIYIVLLILALIFLCLGKNKISKTLLMITLISYLTLVIRDAKPVYAFIVSIFKSGFSAYSSANMKFVIQDLLEIISISLSLFFVHRKKRNSGITFISITVILFIISHWDTIFALFA